MSTVGEMTASRDPIVVASPTFAVEPDFVVGLDQEGHWLAVETHGKGGGIFVSREAALGYARAECSRRPGGVALAAAPLALR